MSLRWFLSEYIYVRQRIENGGGIEGMRLEPILIALIWLNKDMTKMVYLDATTLILLLLASTLWIIECSTDSNAQ